MSSHPPNNGTPGSSSRHHPVPADPSPADDILAGPVQSTDDTPTIISRNTPAPPSTPIDDPGAGVRGRQLAHFELIEPIGVGGMAAVLRARDTQLDRLVALKILPPEMAADAENVRRFHQEARSAAKLDHENIARVFFCGEDQRLHFIAFEFVEGENLRTILERRHRLPVAEAVHYMLQVAAGLAHASRRGVVHRDIKPSNIIITPNGRAKLVDMGLARSLSPKSDNDLTQSGVTLGTFDYISPEQALEPREADVRSDIYSLGCTFYHVVTGQASVPEGTAAKKLHHHQHVKPPDPREYVPDLPVEVVQVLDRMMSKNPRDRYQTPEELVHRLLVVARKLGAAGEVPEGVLSVEASLPNPPSSRPLFWAGLAAVAVVALVLVLDGLPTGPSITRPSSDGNKEPPEAGAVTGRSAPATKVANDTPTTPMVKTEPPAARYEAAADFNLNHLLAWLERHQDSPSIELVLHGELNLSSLQKAGGLVVNAAKKVTIRSKDPSQKVTLRFSYDGVTPGGLVALTLQAPETQVEGVRFLVDAHQSEIQLTSLLLRGGRHVVHRCEFIQAQPSPRPEKRFASLVVQPSRSSPPGLTLSECAFLGYGKMTQAEGEPSVLSGADVGGQVAVVRAGAVPVLADHCVFGPHAAAFQLEEKAAAGDAGKVTVRHCSVMLAARRSAAFDIAAGASGTLVVEHSLFSRYPGEAEDGAVLLRQADEGAGAIVFNGKDNCYYDLDGYWSVRDGWQTAGWRDFRDRLSDGNSDDSSRIVMSNPWQAETGEQRKMLEKEDLARGFALQTGLAALRQFGRLTSTDPVGAAKVLGETWLNGQLRPLTEKADPSLPRILVVEDGGGITEGTYSRLYQAVGEARPGDTIVLRHNGDLAIDPIQLNKTALKDLTIRPARKFRPILTFASETTEADAALFRLHDGKLRLEGLEFRLRPGKDFRSQSLVALVGTGECVLKGCVITLQRAFEAPMALATLVESSKVMKLDMPPARSIEKGPALILEDCFVRGEGDLLWVRAHRPFALEVKESLAALSGSVVNVEVSPETQMPPASQLMRVGLTQSVAYLEGPLIRLSVSKDPRGLLPIHCKATGCLFLPATTGKTFVHLEGAESEDKSLRDKLNWKGGKNAYGGYTSMLTQDGGETMVPPMGMDKWKMLEGEDSSSFGVKMEKTPSAATRFSQMEPDQLKLPTTAREPERDAEAVLGKVPRPSR